MGNNTCCSKPDEKELAGGKMSQNNFETDQVNTLDKDGYPHDSEQVNQDVVKSVPNQELYNQEIQSPKVGNSYQVSVEVKSPNENEPQENNENIQSPNPGDTDAKQSYISNKEMTSPKQEEAVEEEQGEEQREGEEQVEGEAEGEEHVEGEEQGEGEGEEVVEDHGEEQAEGGQVEGQVEGEEQVEGEGEGEGEEGEEYVEEVQEEVEEEGEEKNVDNNLGETVADTKIIDNNIANQGGYAMQQQQQFYSQNDVNNYLQSGNNFISTASAEGAVDLNNLQAYPSTEMNENEDLNKYFQPGAATSNEVNYDYNAQNVSAVPVSTNNIDYNQYSTSGTVDYSGIGTSSVPAPTNIDLNNYGIQGTSNYDLNNYNVGAVSSTTNNVDYNNAVYTNAEGYSLPANNLGSTLTFGEQQGTVEGYNTYETGQATSNTYQTSYSSPIESYSYNYSYNVAGTSNQTNY